MECIFLLFQPAEKEEPFTPITLRHVRAVSVQVPNPLVIQICSSSGEVPFPAFLHAGGLVPQHRKKWGSLSQREPRHKGGYVESGRPSASSAT